MGKPEFKIMVNGPPGSTLICRAGELDSIEPSQEAFDKMDEMQVWGFQWKDQRHWRWCLGMTELMLRNEAGKDVANGSFGL